MCEQNSKQSVSLHKTLLEKKRIKELAKTNPELAFKQLEAMSYQRSHRAQGISSTNATKARKFKKSYCENCGALEKLMIHHKNSNQSDNSPSNIQTLCAGCHHELHRPRKRMEWE